MTTEEPLGVHCEGDNTKDRDLYIFDGMKGFEDFDPMDDSSLSAILDDLQEGTLLSLLNDNSIFNDLNEGLSVEAESNQQTVKLVDNDVDLEQLLEDIDESPRTDGCHLNGTVNIVAECSTSCTFSIGTTDTTEDDRSKDFCEPQPDVVASTMSQELSMNGSSELEGLPATLKRTLEVNPQSDRNTATKRARLEENDDLNHLRACVHHDHSYTSLSGDASHGRNSLSESQRSPFSSSSESVEEGSTSDAGYETMSASTSPGNSSSTSESQRIKPLSPPSSSSSSLPPLPPLGGNVDPVALIDARIKHFMCSREVNLTEEEKETLKAEGLPIPTTLPLTKTEEKALRNVRRKIRNKVSAQESRKRKKQHLMTMEEQVKACTDENVHLKKKVEVLETENKSLMVQIKKLQALLSSNSGTNTKRTTQVGACLMVVVLCFAVFFGGWSPHRLWGVQQPTDYTTSSVRSRSLLSLEHKTNFQSMACDWFRQIFMGEDDEGVELDPFSNLRPSVGCSNCKESVFDTLRDSHHQTSPVVTDLELSSAQGNETLNHTISAVS